MGEHIEEIAVLSSLLTTIAARIESLKLRQQNEELKAKIHEMANELATLKEAKQ